MADGGKEIVLGKTSLHQGSYKWTIRLDQYNSGWVVIGVASRNVNLTKGLRNQAIWGYRLGDGMVRDINGAIEFGSELKVGDSLHVWVVFQNGTGTLSFAVNDGAFKKAFDNVESPVFPVIKFEDKNDKMTIID